MINGLIAEQSKTRFKHNVMEPVWIQCLYVEAK